MTERRDIDIHVPVLARVEGEGALELRVRAGRIERLQLRIFEPPRMFEKFLVGRSYRDLPDMVARICGICPVAYQMSAVGAAERAFGVVPSEWVQRMRRVFYCGEWIQSHALHIHLLAAPDFLGYDSAIAMSKDHPDAVRRGLELQDLGNRLIALLGARSVHPVGARVGGFHQAPPVAEVQTLVRRIEAAIPQAEALVAWTAGLPLPEDEQDFTCVSLRHPTDYPMIGERIVSSDGLDIGIDDYLRFIAEFQVPHSTALHAGLHPQGVGNGPGRPYLLGPLARLNLNHDRLPAPVRDALAASGLMLPSRNMYHSIVARALEILLALHEAKRLLGGYVPDDPAVVVHPQAGTAAGCTEAPRGLLWHRYRFDAQGLVQEATIMPPTSQNQARIEEDLLTSLQRFGLHHDDEVLRRRCETVIRNYDPCISCATHFLTLTVERT